MSARPRRAARPLAFLLASPALAYPALALALADSPRAVATLAPMAMNLPPAFTTPSLFGIAPWQWIGLLVAMVFTYVGGWIVTTLVLRIAARLAERTETQWDDALITASRSPLRSVAALLLFDALLVPLALPDRVHGVCENITSSLLVIAVAALAVRLAGIGAELLEKRMTKGRNDPPRARAIHTLLLVARRVAAVVIGVVATAMVLTQFEVARNFGRAMLASAGVATILAGLAAQKSLSGLMAGIQIALTQPIRVGDTVIVENEWGTIEEITFSFVVVRVWDQRRLIVPINYFLEKPFQNWTRASSEIMGTVELHADYTVPVPRVRAELERLCRGHAKWDGRVAGLVVTATTAHTVTLRALVSSADAGANWDLRCEVREGLIAFLQQLDGGRYLPRTRFEHADLATERVSAARTTTAVS